jgi:serine/threonine protein kinase/Tol biopolymer transport system component
MSTERWQQLDRIFIEAVQRPAGERVGFIEDACKTDAALQADALALLAAADGSRDFMTTSALEYLAKTVAETGWTLKPGDRIGAYTVVTRLGSGGSGEVWRARDERLGRDVAIKSVLSHTASDADWLRRFADEARLAGSLNHPNLLTVHDVGEHAGLPVLVTECLEGQTLRFRLGAGPLPVRRAISVALGVARGLAAAHACGVVHRDVKPENVFLPTDGGVKILDFGLAKLVPPAASQLAAPCQTMDGLILGTAGYMAPEQVRGEPVDARADLFAVGVITYEMLTGHNPLKRANIIETLNATLTADVPDVSTANCAIPPALAKVVARLLEKAPPSRFQSAHDLAWAIEQVADVVGIDRTRVHPPSGRRARWLVAVAATLVVAAGSLGAWLSGTRRTDDRAIVGTSLTQFTWALPQDLVLDSPPVVSPDSQRIVFAARADAGESRLFIRELAVLEPVVLAGTEGAKQPFWSPDGSSLGYFSHGKLMKLALPAGAPVVLADAMDGRGGTWSRRGTIVYGPDLVGSALFKVPAAGGRAEPATLLDDTEAELSHRWPVFLPDGLRFLYFVRSANSGRRGVYVGRIDAPAAMPGAPLLVSESEAVWVPDALDARFGDLLTVNQRRIEVRRLDAERLTPIGDARALEWRVGEQTPYHPSMFSASQTALAFASEAVPFGQRLASVNRTGDDLQRQDAEAQGWVRLSPDGRRLARQRMVKGLESPDIWVDDLDRGTHVRITSAPVPDIYPVWSPDGSRLAYVTGNPPGRAGARVISIAAADGSGVVESFACPGGPDAYCEPTDWSGDRLLVTVRTARGGDIWIVAADKDHASHALLAESYNERDGRVSPNGRWIAYVSDESGRTEVSVRSLVGDARRLVLSRDGGDQPVWRKDGNELFFIDPQGRLRALAANWTNPLDPTFGLPAVLPIPPVGLGHWGTQYDVTPSGRRIYFMQRNRDAPPSSLTVVLGWRSLLK